MSNPQHPNFPPQTIGCLLEIDPDLAAQVIARLLDHPEHWKAVAQAHDAGVIPELAVWQKAALERHAQTQVEAEAYVKKLHAKEQASENGGVFHAILRSIYDEDIGLFASAAAQITNLAELVSRDQLPQGWKLAQRLPGITGSKILRVSRFAAMMLTAELRKDGSSNIDLSLLANLDIDLLGPAVEAKEGRGSRIYTHLDLGLYCRPKTFQVIMNRASRSGELKNRSTDIIGAIDRYVSEAVMKSPRRPLEDFKSLAQHLVVAGSHSLIPSKEVLELPVEVTYKTKNKKLPEETTYRGPLRLAMPLMEQRAGVPWMSCIGRDDVIPVSLWTYMIAKKSRTGPIVAKSRGYDLNEVNEQNRINPMHVAASLRNYALIESCVKMEVDGEAKDLNDRTPCDWLESSVVKAGKNTTAREEGEKFRSFVAACKAQLIVKQVNNVPDTNPRPL